ncbi:hypothetical protein Q1695_012456 [Nippostrongylus brasiliensis]|nr:hypothetical protein Q1695_012456 [Nippostrongylus brasiliensis]
MPRSEFRALFSELSRMGKTVENTILSKYHAGHNKDIYLKYTFVFVDYREAFDSVDINAVLNALVHAGLPSPYVQLLDECFSNTSTTIQLFDRKLTIPIEKGVRQGDTISAKLITAALQDAMKNLD